jgi:cob(I)alamin adenosyltransferase
MARLDRISTGTGDRGTTSLADGSRVAKNSPRVCAYGTVDELNSLIGVVLLEELPEEIGEDLRRIQNELFDLGADLATPLGGDEKRIPRLEARQVQRLETAIAAGSARVEPAASFILPGGRPAAARLHLARAVARRAEREVFTLIESQEGAANPLCLTYLNRLSDLCFVWARCATTGGGRMCCGSRGEAVRRGDPEMFSPFGVHPFGRAEGWAASGAATPGL